MLHLISTWLLVAAFFGAGAFNAIGTAATRSNFVRWGFPGWWCRVTGILEIVVAALIALPTTREFGLILGAVIIASAALAVMRRGEWLAHLPPLGFFAVLLAIAPFFR